MEKLNSKKFIFVDFKKLIIFQLIFLFIYFSILYIQNLDIIYLVPFLFINIFIYIYLIEPPRRLLNFFFILMPISTIGLFPVFYREIFLYCIPIFGLFFIGATRFINKSDLHLTWTPISKYIILLLIALVISFINATLHGWYSIKLVRQCYTLIESITLLIVIISVLNDKDNLRKSVEILFFSASVATLVFLLITFAQGLAFSRRIIVPYADFSLNEVAIFFAPYIAIGISLFWSTNTRKKKTLILISVIIIVITTIITQSRGAWIAVLCSTLYLFIKRKYYRGIFIAGIFVLLLFAFSIFRNIFSLRLAATGSGDISLLHRFAIWKTALSVIAKNFLFGVGMNNFVLIKYEFGFPSWLDVRKIYHTHNIYFEILANLGIIGFIGFGGLILKTISRLNKIISSNLNSLSTLALGFKAAILIFLIHGIVDSGLFRNVIFFNVMVILGLSWVIIKSSDLLKLQNTKSTRIPI